MPFGASLRSSSSPSGPSSGSMEQTSSRRHNLFAPSRPLRTVTAAGGESRYAKRPYLRVSFLCPVSPPKPTDTHGVVVADAARQLELPADEVLELGADLLVALVNLKEIAQIRLELAPRRAVNNVRVNSVVGLAADEADDVLVRVLTSSSSCCS